MDANIVVDVISAELDQLHASRRQPRIGLNLYFRMVHAALLNAMLEAGL